MAMPLPDNLFVYAIEENGKTRELISPIPTGQTFQRGLPSQGIIGEFRGGRVGSGPQRVALNPTFLAFVHKVLAKHGPLSPGIEEAAVNLGSGSLSIIDHRTPDPKGAVAGQDIIGAFAVAGGRLGAYSANPRYKLVNQHGFVQLPDWYHERLLAELRAL